jgi:hypothetical protein
VHDLRLSQMPRAVTFLCRRFKSHSIDRPRSHVIEVHFGALTGAGRAPPRLPSQYGSPRA